jgi:radical SAM superfamily enzyme YgiQ (UPF0313 family)
MKIIFANPPWWEKMPDDSLRQGVRAGSRWPFTRPACHMPDQFRFGGYLPFPFFLAHAAAHTAQELPGATVGIRDSIARGESYQSFFDYLNLVRPDWLVLETATAAWSHDKTLLHLLAQGLPQMRIILAGPLDATKAAQIMADLPSVAAIVQGEYDKQIVPVVTGKAKGLLCHNLLTQDELSASPLPMWDEVAALHYFDACPPMKSGERAPQLTLWASRGCPFKCIFCVWPAVMTGNDPDGTKARKVRTYSPEYIERHIRVRLARAMAAGTPIKSIYFDDDTFNLVERHTLKIAAVMKKIGLPWSAMCRADTLSWEGWCALAESGCYGVKLGFESGSQTVIDTIINKHLDLKNAAYLARRLRAELGMTVHGTFTVGLPGETEAQQAETVAFIKELYATGGLDSHQLSGTAEIEGTPLHTLATAGHLDKYAGAKIDAGYITSADGQKKIEQLSTRAIK